jgi:hypothetical protein
MAFRFNDYIDIDDDYDYEETMEIQDLNPFGEQEV